MATLAELGLPRHVPPSRVFDFDFAKDPLLHPEPHEGLKTLRALAPAVFFTPRYGGHWVVQSHDAIFQVTQDPETFSSRLFNQAAMLPITSDPPEHYDYRYILLPAFAPKQVNAMLPMIRSLTLELIDKVADQGRCEFTAAVAEPLPVLIFMKMLGLPAEYMSEIRRLIIASLLAGEADERFAIWQEQLDSFLDPLIAARMQKREADMVSQLLDSRIGDRELTLDEIQRYMLLLTNAGLDTVTNAMSFTFLHLARDQPLQQRVRSDPALVPALVEEMLRRYAVSSVLRRVTRDTTLNGAQLQAGDNIHVLLPAGNLDPAVFESPDEIILGRKIPAVTFGTGIHRCLGSHLARLEIRNLLVEWLARIPTFTIDEGCAPEMHAGMVYTVDSLPLRWDMESVHA